MVRLRAQIHSAVLQPRNVPMPDDDEMESICDDDKSKSSFSSWGADKITLQKPVTKQRPTSVYSGESSTNAKFGHRLVSADSSAARPSSSRTVTRPAATSDEGRPIRVTVTRPAWGESTRTPATSVQSTKRSRNTATRTTTAPPNKPPAEDSGVGLYRQMMANDLSLNDD